MDSESIDDDDAFDAELDDFTDDTSSKPESKI
jgi:hypothetical protein